MFTQSRRIQQRKRKQSEKEIQLKFWKSYYETKLERTREYTRYKCIQSYGYVANPDKTNWENAQEIIGNKKVAAYLSELKNMSSHNLCTHLKPPHGYNELLGLGLNICFMDRHPAPNVNE